MISRIRKYSLNILINYLVLSFIWVLAYRYIDPPYTFLMLSRNLSSTKGSISHSWVNEDAISPYIKTCAMASEDQNFPEHFGLDIDAIQKAVNFNTKHKRTRGASTITQQVAKNVFLWPGRSFMRKAFELQFTLYIEFLWSKKRILEVYLNMIETGPMTFGVEAASQKYFKKHASKLNLTESAQIISVLPSPLKWNPIHPGPFVYKRQKWIIQQFNMLGGLSYLNELD